MNLHIDKIHPDYRQFDEMDLGYSFSKRVLHPAALIERKEGLYVISLGARIKKSGEFLFVACPSLAHNWILDGDRIKPLPFDAPSVLLESLSGMDPENLSFSEVLLLSRAGIDGIEVNVDPEVFEKAKVRALRMSLPGDIQGLKANLYPYQEHGVSWIDDALKSLGGGILADEMGLGKTIQIIAVLLQKDLSETSPALIVCPTTLITNWSREIERFAPSLSFLIHRGGERSGYYKDLMRSKVVITTYDTLVNDISLFRSIEWKFLVCDEAQAVKNPDSKRRQALAKVPRRYTVPITGTPMENSLLDVWSLVDLAIPGLFGGRDQFLLEYPDTEEGATKLNTIADSVILKRQVKEVANDLPKRIDVDFPVSMDDSLRDSYERVKTECIDKYGRAGQLVAVGQLALHCAHPWLIGDASLDLDGQDAIELFEDVNFSLLTPKIDLCIRLLREAFLTNKKVLVFATYNHCYELLKRAAAKMSVPEAYWNGINGATPQNERQSIVDEFAAYEGAAVLVLNPKAAGAGLNITAATIVIHYTQNWNPALEMQASARAHRRGQMQPVTVYRLYYENTVEEIMVERCRWKRELGDAAIPISTREKSDLIKALAN